ncbi:MAG: DUF4258 domain-containing protein [Gammaproteobacteria bacterium]|nr:DUF4258 domain-containing protein [Gammaproteobacteria bacterium]
MKSDIDGQNWLHALRQAAQAGKIEWKQHALERLFGRGIPSRHIEEGLQEGELVEFYPGAYPVAACLLLCFCDGQPLHIVVAFQEQQGVCHVITVYRPSTEKFETDWKTRK